MRWSKLKQRIEDRFADKLQGRLQIFETLHRMGHNHRLGEIWLTLEKERIFSTSDMNGWQRMNKYLSEGNSYDQAYEKTAMEGTLPVYQSNKMLFETLNMTIDDMLESRAVLVRGLGIVDARCGLRRLKRMEADIKAEHSFIQRLYVERISKAIT